MARTLHHYVDTSRGERVRDILTIATQLLPNTYQSFDDPKDAAKEALKYAEALYDAACDMQLK